MDASPIGFQSLMLQWPVPQVEVLQVEVLDIGSNAFAPQGEAESCEFPPDCMNLCWGCGLGGNVFQPFLPSSM